MSDFHSGASDFEAHAATCPSCGKSYLMDAHWKRVCISCYLRTKGKAAPPARQLPAPAIEPDMLKRLIYLTHPDKHGGSQAALVATQWLLKQRELQHE